MADRKKVLFVCTANTCRSAVAEAILNEYGLDRYFAYSAGIYARGGEPMMAKCAEALEELFGHGFSAYSHTSTRLHATHLADNDIIVAVSEGYADILRATFPFYKDKITAFPHGIADISCLSGDALTRAIERIKNEVFEMFSL